MSSLSLAWTAFPTYLVLKSKGSLFEATPAQDPYAMAQKAVEVGAGVMSGKKP